jgi:hypothetical protein
MEPKTSFIFLLGGHDLEMAEINKIPEERGVKYHDQELGLVNNNLTLIFQN